jgi:hypothetical protein
MILNGRIVTTLVMLAIFAGMSLMALGYAPKARYLPLLVSIPGTLMCLGQLLLDIRHARQARTSGSGAEEASEPAETAREIKMFAWLGIFFAGILAFGFLYAAPVVVAAYLKFGEREGWMTSVAAGVAAWLILYVVFGRLLELFLFEGLVTPMIFG